MAQCTRVDWQRWKREGIVIVVTAASITLSLWLKRLIEKLVVSRVVDKEILEKGIGGAKTQQQTYFKQENLPTSPQVFRDGRWQPRHGGPGTTLVTVNGQNVVVRYRRTIDCEGLTLYQHDEILRADHVTACPLLRSATACTSCVHYFDEGPTYWRSPICIAEVKVSEHADDSFGLSSLRRMYEQSL